MLLILTKIKKKCTFQQVYLIDVSLFIIHKSNFSISKHKKQKQKIGVSQLNVDQKVNKYINNYWLVIDRVRMYLKTGFQVLEEPGHINPIFGTGKCNFRHYNISDPSLNIGLFYGGSQNIAMRKWPFRNSTSVPPSTMCHGSSSCHFK